MNAKLNGNIYGAKSSRKLTKVAVSRKVTDQDNATMPDESLTPVSGFHESSVVKAWFMPKTKDKSTMWSIWGSNPGPWRY